MAPAWPLGHLDPYHPTRLPPSITRDGGEIGSSGRVNLWGNRVTLDVDASVPIEHQVFPLWLSAMMRRRESSAAGA